MADEARALVVTRTGGPEVLEVRSREVPEPGPGELVVDVAASGVNFIDVYRRQGVYPVQTPFVLGGECAGTVRAIGPDVQDFAVGDVVASAAAQGSHASVAVLPAAQTVKVPAGLDPPLAAAAMLQGMTAHYLVNSTYAVQPGEWTLVHAAAGGMGQLLVQMIRTKGAHVVATVGSAEKADIARSRGADAVLRYDEFDDLAAAVREASGGGVHVAYDGVGKATFEASLASLRVRGMMALFGGASGQVPPFDLQRLNSAGSLFVTRPTLAHYVREPEELAWRAGDVLGALADGSLEIEVGGRYSLEEAGQAYENLENRRTTGKLLLIP
jgi:NADPH2:quinone reductase